MKGIIIRAFIFLLPILGVAAAYAFLDPFKVIGTYSNYKPEGLALNVPLNQNRVSAGTFLFYNDSIHYNSFIFGSSRSMFYEVKDWQAHLKTDARCFHFDASAETIEGILHKIQFLERQRVEFQHVLLILDVDIFRPYTLLNEHLYMEDPLVVGYSKWLTFQSSHFMAFLDRKFLRAYSDFQYSGIAKPYMAQLNLLDDKPFEYNPVSNELRYTHFEKLDEAGQYYTDERMKKFQPQRDGKQRFSAPVIDSRKKEQLAEIAQILGEHNCDTRIVISPLFNQINMAKEDLMTLGTLFGEKNVYDFSGVNNLTESYTGYYERSHYRPHIARAVLDSVYSVRPY
jgi:hypothetical protein